MVYFRGWQSKMFEIGNCGGSKWNSHPKASFYKWREGASSGSSTDSSDGHLEMGHQWPLICVILIVLDCFSLSSVPESVCSHFFEEILEVVAVYVMATIESSCSSSAW